MYGTFLHFPRVSPQKNFLTFNLRPLLWNMELCIFPCDLYSSESEKSGNEKKEEDEQIEFEYKI